MSNQRNHDNRANQMNPNNDAYWQARGWDGRPQDWEERSTQEGELVKEETQVRHQMKK